MTRDRPAAGGGDSTLDGEFPSDLGGEGEGKREPKSISRLADFHGDPTNQAGNFQYNFRDIGISADYQYPGTNVLAIRNTPIGGSLSGIYTFQSTFGLFNTAYNTLSTSIYITNTNVASINSTSLGTVNVTAGKAAGWKGYVSATMNTTIRDLSLNMSVNNLSPDFFNTYIGSGGAVSVNSLDELSKTNINAGANLAPYPRYQYRYLKGQGGDLSNNSLLPIPFIPNSSTSFSLYINSATGAAVTSSANITLTVDAFIYEFAEPTPDGTITSSL